MAASVLYGRPRSLSHAARYVMRRAASISVAISAIMNATPWKEPIGRSNCRRSFAYAAAAS
jgi:hypothetical protein